MEMSHRSAEFEGINTTAEEDFRKAAGHSRATMRCIFVQGGGSLQFAMVPMNLCLPGKPVDVLHTGSWTAKALEELKKGVPHRIAASTEAEKFPRVPRKDEISAFARGFLRTYVHQQHHRRHAVAAFPETGEVPLVADMSSDIASRAIDVQKFGLIFACAQKNLGPAGVTVVIIRKDLAERADKDLPTMLQYRTHIKEKSLYHTPPTFAIYVVGLMMEWIGSEGGAAGIEKAQRAKAELLYDTIDSERLLHMPGREKFTLENERGLPGGGGRRGPREEVRAKKRKRPGLPARRGIARWAGCGSRFTTRWTGSSRGSDKLHA